eukprot:COSAG06_NODE_5353_length_3530_cov_14.353250_1_plen_74_part_00
MPTGNLVSLRCLALTSLAFLWRGGHKRPLANPGRLRLGPGEPRTHGTARYITIPVQIRECVAVRTGECVFQVK